MVASYELLLAKEEVAFGTSYYDHPDLDFGIQPGDSVGPFLGRFFPIVPQLHHALNRAIGNQSGTVAAIAVYRYQKRYGQLPNSLDQLVGEFLDAVPIDQCNGQPLHYQTNSNGFKIYSVGVDGVDDGGTPIMVQNDKSSSTVDDSNLRPQKASDFYFARRDLKGDWVLWPRLSAVGREVVYK